VANRTEAQIKKILELARKRWKRTVESWSENYTDALDILKFKHGIDQWSQEEQRQRKDAHRPCLTLNELPKFSQQVCGDGRQNKTQIKVSPADDAANQLTANTRAGIIKNAEYLSNADAIYDHARKMLVDSGFGAWRVMAQYKENSPFEQELRFKGIDNPLSVHMDPDAEDRMFMDAEYAFIDTPMSVDTFEEVYGKDRKPKRGVMGAVLDTMTGTDVTQWYGEKNVIIREYFYKEYTVETLCLLSDGQTMEKSVAEKHIAQMTQTLMDAKTDQDQMRAEALATGAPFDEAAIDLSEAPTIIKEREVETPHVKWMTITADEILDEGEWPGTIIPIVFVTGEYTNIGGKKYFNGLFRHAKDPQRMLNNSYTSLHEAIALMPKAPWQASAKMVEGYEPDYLSTNQENFPFLKFKPDPDFPGMIPRRSDPVNPPQALFAQLADCKNDIKDMIGMYNADLGDVGREVSGKAILARQQPGDTATFIYHDIMAMAIAHGGKIFNDAMGKYYDTERDERLRGADDKESFTMINTTAGAAARAIIKNPQRYEGMDKKELKKILQTRGPAEPFNNIADGKYDVVVTTGPSFATQRQESAENIMKLAQVAGRMMPEDIYSIIKALDFPGADEWAKMKEKRVPAGMIPPKEGEEPQKPEPPSPEMLLEMAKVELEGDKIKTEAVRLQYEIVRLQNELAQSKENVNAAIIDKLGELIAPVHPADIPPPTPPQMDGTHTPEGQQQYTASYTGGQQ